MAVSGNTVNLGSFLEQALSPANPQPRVKWNDWEGHAHGNPILERPGVGHCISRIFLVCRNTPARKISTLTILIQASWKSTVAVIEQQKA